MDQNLTLYPVLDSMQPITVSLALGDSDELIEQLIAKSRQPAILKYTPKDASERFSDRQTYETWKSKGREVHWLLGTNNDLAGIMWYGPSPFPLDVSLDETPTETCAIRIYDGYAGHGLAKPFMRLSLRVHLEQKQKRGEQAAGLWLQTDADNPAAIAVYSKFGYHEVGRDSKRVTMVLSSAEANAIAKE